MKKIIVAIDSFKGSLTSAEANQAASEGVLLWMPDAEVVQVPVSDGGDELRYTCLYALCTFSNFYPDFM
jgi:glycerate kinase